MGPCDCAEEGEFLEESQQAGEEPGRIQPNALPTTPHLAERSLHLVSARLGSGGHGWRSPQVCARGRGEMSPTIKGKLPRPQAPRAASKAEPTQVSLPVPPQRSVPPSAPPGGWALWRQSSCLGPGAREILTAPAPPGQQVSVWTEGSGNWAQRQHLW